MSDELTQDEMRFIVMVRTHPEVIFKTYDQIRALEAVGKLSKDDMSLMNKVADCILWLNMNPGLPTALRFIPTVHTLQTLRRHINRCHMIDWRSQHLGWGAEHFKRAHGLLKGKLRLYRPTKEQ